MAGGSSSRFREVGVCRVLEELHIAATMWIFIQFKTSHLLPGLDEKVRIEELQHFSSTMNFKNGIAMQSSD